MTGTGKASGAANRKRKVHQMVEDRKAAVAMRKFVKMTTNEETSSTLTPHGIIPLNLTESNECGEQAKVQNICNSDAVDAGVALLSGDCVSDAGEPTKLETIMDGDGANMNLGGCSLQLEKEGGGEGGGKGGGRGGEEGGRRGGEKGGRRGGGEGGGRGGEEGGGRGGEGGGRGGEGGGGGGGENGSEVGGLMILPVIRKNNELLDPAKWMPIRNTDYVDEIIKLGPLPVKDKHFPRDSDKRHFSLIHCYRVMTNGEKVLRRWLVYSESVDRIFCFCCKIFDKRSTAAFANGGFHDWRHSTDALSSHEKSAGHFHSYALWTEADVRISRQKGIDDAHQRIINAELQHWRSVLERLISVTLYLSENNLAFRGSSDKLYTKNNGNFLQLVELLGKYDPVTKEHLCRWVCNEDSDHYCSKGIQNELINLLGESILEKILTNVKKAKYFSIIADCTPDLSRKEQVSFTLRFVEEKDDDVIGASEYFICFKEATKSTGEALSDLIIDTLTEMGLNIKDLRGQGYDNGANMKGIRKGVQARIQERFPRAKYVPCGCHSLNLVLCDSAESSRYCITLFGVLQRVYNFFSGSPGRSSILQDHISNLTLKPLCETRWESRVDSVKPFRYDLKGVVAALKDVNQNLAFDVGARYEAECLINQIVKFEFIVSVVVWYDILFQINIVSKAMQAEAIDLQSACSLSEGCIEFLEKYYTEGFDGAVTSAIEIAAEVTAPPKIVDNTARNSRPLQRLIAEIGDNPVQVRQSESDSESERSMSESDISMSESEIEMIQEQARLLDFKNSFFYTLMDVALKSIKKRFLFFKKHSEIWSFLYDLKALPGSLNDNSLLMDHCKKLQKELSEGSDCDINAVDLCSELQHLSPCLPANATTPGKALQFIHKTKIMDTFPNVNVALRVLLTLPVSVASGERSFNRLKSIKTYKSSNMGQLRLSNLALISIESDVARSLDIQQLITQFANVKARKAPFL